MQEGRPPCSLTPPALQTILTENSAQITTSHLISCQSPCKLAHQVGGGGAYSGWEGSIDAKKLSNMGFTMNWKASIDFPYMGLFLPPVKDDEKWNRFAGGGEGDFTSQDEGRFGQTSIRQTSAYSTDMRAQEFHVLNYFNVTEFGANITYPAPPAKNETDPVLWKDPNDLLHDRLEETRC
jgi:hypothetical protein